MRCGRCSQAGSGCRGIWESGSHCRTPGVQWKDRRPVFDHVQRQLRWFVPETYRQTRSRNRSHIWSFFAVSGFRSRLAIRFFCVVVLGSFFVIPAGATISYQISLAHPELHTFHVKMTIPDVKDSITVQMPAWNALYEIRDFASHVLQATAANESGPLPVEKLDKQTWRIKGAGKITISYDTFWDEPGPFASQLNTEHAFINPALVLMYVPDRRREGIALGFADTPLGWKLATTAPSFAIEFSSIAAWRITTDGYDELADSPIEFGNADYFILPGGLPKTFATVHGKLEHPDIFREKLARICKYQLSL